MMRTIFLLGFMGAGKSHSGRKLGMLLGRDFYDLDEYLVLREGRTIAEIFEVEGEERFRLLESKYLKELGKQEGIIVATGGGTPCFFDHMDWMNELGMTIYLKTSTEILSQRLWPEMEHRPLLQGKSKAALVDFIEEKVAARSAFYETAHVIVEQSEAEEDTAELIARAFKNIVGH